MTIEEKSLKPGKILVVDECPSEIELLTVILTLQGYKIEQTPQVNLAFKSAITRPPDIILLDLGQPDIDSFEVCQQLGANPTTRDIPIIFISAIDRIDCKIRAFKCGASDYITRPFDISEVIARINHQLQISRLKIELKLKNARLERELLKRQLVEKKLLNLNQQLDKLASIDGLTQVANRRIFDEFLTREWQRGQREQQDLALIFCDLDYFKLYNDSLGHQSGDFCLRKVAQTISSAVRRPADLVARYGGEEFTIILPQTSAQNALQVAEKIRLKVKQLCLPHPESPISKYVSLSLGVSCVIPQPKYDKKQLINTADRALYEAKKQGRDRSVLITDY